MATTTLPPKRSPPAPPSAPSRTNGNGNKPAPLTAGTPTFSEGPSRKAHRTGLYGTGGIGKSSLAASLNRIGLNPKFLDLESGTHDLAAGRWDIDNWQQLRDVLNSPSNWKEDDVPVIDTLTKAQELCAAHVIANVKKENGASVTSIEGYGYGKGFTYLYEEFLKLLADLDRHHERGRSVVLICHDCKARVPNPMGEDYIRYEPLLQSTAEGKASIRERFKNWCDHLLFIGYDVFANDGKAKGSGTRQIYTAESPTFLAKSRTLSTDPIPFEKDSADVWAAIFGKEVK